MAALILVPEVALRTLMMQVVSTSHSLTDTGGSPVVLNTISEDKMRMAAIIALQIVSGQPVWPGDQPISIKRPKPANYGIFQED